MQTRLAAGHQQGQARLAEAIARLIAARWRTLVTAPGVGGDEFLERALRDIRMQYDRSSRLASSYYGQSRRLAVPGAPAFAPTAPVLEDEAVIVALVASGFEELSRELAAGQDLAAALERAGDSAARAAARTSLAGGRHLITDAVARDSVALGYYWQTREDGKAPCSWCAMLASRGPVFKETSWESDPRPDGRKKVSAHDNCACHLAPVWSQDQELPDGIADLYNDWIDVQATGRWGGHDAIKAWRRFYEAMDRGEEREAALLRAKGGARDGNWATSRTSQK